MEIPTPLYDHVYGYEDVYEPAEDTFLLLDTLESDIDQLNKLEPTFVLEVGCGSGIVGAFVASVFKKSAFYLSTDLNPSATKCCLETGNKNSALLNPITTHFVNGLLPRMKHEVDLLLFNPPYVVTPSEEVNNGGISLAWAGGVKGREVMDKFFDLVPQLLSAKGLFYLVVLKENDPQEIIEHFKKNGMMGEILKTRKSGIETLSVIRFSRTNVKMS